jgi:hypothetical protein
VKGELESIVSGIRRKKYKRVEKSQKKSVCMDVWMQECKRDARRMEPKAGSW